MKRPRILTLILAVMLCSLRGAALPAAAPYAIGLRPGAVVRSAQAGDLIYVEQNLSNSVAIHGKGAASGSIGVWGEGVNNTGVYG